MSLAKTKSLGMFASPESQQILPDATLQEFVPKHTQHKKWNGRIPWHWTERIEGEISDSYF